MKLSNIESEEEIAGRRLKLYLQKMYPAPNQFSSNVFSSIDSDFSFDGEFLRITYDSVINNLIRRLIKTAHYFMAIPPEQEVDSHVFKARMKGYFRDHTDFPDKTKNELIKCIQACLVSSVEKITPGVRNSILRSAKGRDLSCYMCGQTIDYSSQNKDDSYTLDHQWPRSLGGPSDDSNLAIACAKCNNRSKRDFVDGSDFHYEHICFSVIDYKDYQSNSIHSPVEFARQELAIFAKAGYKCAACAKPASLNGKLFVGRINDNDSWHFLNLTAYCIKHKPADNDN